MISWSQKLGITALLVTIFCIAGLSHAPTSYSATLTSGGIMAGMQVTTEVLPNRALKISWTPPESQDVIGYSIRYKRKASIIYRMIYITNPRATTATLRGFSEGKDYTLEVIARGSGRSTIATSGPLQLTYSANGVSTPVTTTATPTPTSPSTSTSTAGKCSYKILSLITPGQVLSQGTLALGESKVFQYIDGIQYYECSG
jgi:hypothetical protein